ncbi:MAG: hypothetical protein ACP5M8_06865 [Caldisphaera sp.]
MAFNYRKFNLIITIVLLAIISISIALPSLYFGSEKTLTINPYVTQGSILLSLGYYKIMHETSLGNYSYSKALLNVINKTSILIVPNEENLIKRFNQFLNLIINQLNETKSNISMGYYYLNIGNISGALNLSKKALTSIRNANSSTVWISYLASELSNVVGPYNYLQNGLNEIKASEGNLTNEIYNLIKEINLSKGNVSLNLHVNTTNAWLGNITKIYGNVTYLNEGLSNAIVELIFPNYSVNITTNLYGGFSYYYKIPYIYNNNTCIYAIFIPDNTYNYLHENSSYVCIKTLFISPKINITLNQTKVLPSGKVKIYIKIDNVSKEVSKTVFIYLENYGLIREIKSFNNEISTNVTIPNVPNGNYSIYVIMQPNGIYNKAESYSLISVYRLTPNLTVNIPKIVYSGEYIVINGVSYYNGTALSNSTIVLNYLGKNISLKTDNEGKFKIKVLIPFTYMNSYINFTIYDIPNESYYANVYEIKKSLVINPMVLMIGGLILFTVSRYFYEEKAKRNLIGNSKEKRKKEERKLEEQKEFNNRRKILGDAFNIFLKETYYKYSVELEENMTLREFFNKIVEKRKDIKEKLNYILNLIEREIYGYGLNDEDFNNLINLLLGAYK